MRISDLLRISLKTLKKQWTILLAAGMAGCTFCLCFSGAIFNVLRQEKARPYELVVSSEGTERLSDEMIARLSEIPGVKAVTPVLQVPVSIKTGKYTAQLTLTGIDAAYLQEPFSAGGIFPDSSVMPYIVLNAAACKQFADDGEKPPTVDWLNAGFLLQTGGSGKASVPNTGGKAAASGDGGKESASGKEDKAAMPVDNGKISAGNGGKTAVAGKGGKTISSKVCGTLAQQSKQVEQEPSAYISLAAAKDLLRKSGQSTDYTAAHVRVINSGEAARVSKAITVLGITAANPNESLQAKWDAFLKEANYLAAMGAFGLLCSATLFSVWRKAFFLEQKESLDMLLWFGMSPKNLNRLFIMQMLIHSFLGGAIGLVVSFSLPSFLPADLGEASVFMLSIPPGTAVLSVAICTAAVFLPIIFRFGH